jgi:predicted DNA-binding protein YlxM (UPF0122 family)
MEKIVEQGMLYDFYGELLTEHQRKIYEDVVLNDMSLSEIAEEQGISRQGVHDLVRRCDRTLQSYEEQAHRREDRTDQHGDAGQRTGRTDFRRTVTDRGRGFEWHLRA